MNNGPRRRMQGESVANHQQVVGQYMAQRNGRSNPIADGKYNHPVDGKKPKDNK